MRDTSQWDNPDRCSDNPHRVGPENLSNLYGCSVEGNGLTRGEGLAFARFPQSKRPEDLFILGGNTCNSLLSINETIFA
jgi:hypothetical protein